MESFEIGKVVFPTNTMSLKKKYPNQLDSNSSENNISNKFKTDGNINDNINKKKEE